MTILHQFDLNDGFLKSAGRIGCDFYSSEGECRKVQGLVSMLKEMGNEESVPVDLEEESTFSGEEMVLILQPESQTGPLEIHVLFFE